MDIKQFESLVDQHSLCPGNRLYNAVALAGEVGEALNLLKKREMAIMRPEWVVQNENALPPKAEFEKKLIDELGDILFYLTRTAHDAGITLDGLAYHQADKLHYQTIQYGRTFLK